MLLDHDNIDDADIDEHSVPTAVCLPCALPLGVAAFIILLAAAGALASLLLGLAVMWQPHVNQAGVASWNAQSYSIARRQEAPLPDNCRVLHPRMQSKARFGHVMAKSQ